MTDHTHSPGSEVAPAGSTDSTVRVADRFDNPGLPPHRPRRSDVDPKAAKRAERQVAALFTLSILGTIAFIVFYFVLPTDARADMLAIGPVNLSNVALGLSLAVSMLGIGLGAVHWAKTLMPDTEMVEMRHEQASTPEERRKAAGILSTGLAESQLTRRPALLITAGGALSLFALPLALQVVGGLGDMPIRKLRETVWTEGKRLMIDPAGTPVRPADLTQGSVVHVLPEGYVGHDVLHGEDAPPADEVMHIKATASVILVRLNPSIIRSQKQLDWGYEGIVAYSKICTHVGCPVALYERQTHHLLCPCHQSTFDMTNDCEVIFGPAKRPLPQLPISVDDDGYLIATGDFAEPVGPSFWERGL